LVLLSVLGSFDREVAHFPLDHAWVAPVPAFWIDLTTDLGQQRLIMIIVVGEGEKIPVSTRGTG
jgi:hypothetical protein